MRLDMDEHVKHDEAAAFTEGGGAAAGDKRPYRRPELVAYGNVRELTRGFPSAPFSDGPGKSTRPPRG